MALAIASSADSTEPRFNKGVLEPFEDVIGAGGGGELLQLGGKRVPVARDGSDDNDQDDDHDCQFFHSCSPLKSADEAPISPQGCRSYKFDWLRRE